VASKKYVLRRLTVLKMTKNVQKKCYWRKKEEKTFFREVLTIDIYSGSQKSEVCPMPGLAYARFGLCPMPDSTSYEILKGYM
jgi:hypothetical protein